MGKSKRSGKRSHTVAIHGSSAYPYAPKVAQPRHKPLQRTPYSASDLRRLFASVKGQNGTSKSGRSGPANASLARRAASGLERLIARILQSPQPSHSPASSSGDRRRSIGSSSSEGSPGKVSPQRALAAGDVESIRVLAPWDSSPSEMQLKRLGFVLQYADYYFNWGYGLAASVYSTGRALVPGPLAGVTTSLETTVTQISLPVIMSMQNHTGKVLNALDAKVDGVINAASGLYNSNATALSTAMTSTEKGLDACAEAKDNYLRRIEESVALLKEHGVGGAAGRAADRVVATVGSVKDIPAHLETEAKALMVKVGDAWAKLAALPPVRGLVASVQPSIDFAWTKYLEAHDAVVTAPSYTKAVDLGAEQLRQVQDSVVYKALYPHISAVADPALDAIAQSGPYTALVDHLRPQLGGPAAAAT